MSVTINDVARKANTSVATVSRVMNGNYPVGKETKARVLRAIKELNYIPNLQARELTKKTSSTIGVIVPSITNMFFPSVIYGIETELKKENFSIILMTTSNNEEEERRCINELLSRNVAGIIIIGPNTSNIDNNFYNNIANQLPIVFVNGAHSVTNVSSVSNDEVDGSTIALKYLIKNNHEDILFIRGKQSYSYNLKEQVYIKLMKTIDNFLPENIINIGKGNSIDTVDITTSVMLDILPTSKATAIFACNDLMAIGALNACKKLNLDVPNDISIIGYDNTQLSSLVEPKLTTMDQNMYLLGTNASELLLNKIECDNEYSKKIVLFNTLVERNTVRKLNPI